MRACVRVCVSVCLCVWDREGERQEGKEIYRRDVERKRKTNRMEGQTGVVLEGCSKVGREEGGRCAAGRRKHAGERVKEGEERRRA